MTGRSERLRNHWSFNQLQIAGRSGAFHGEILLEVTRLEFHVLHAIVFHDSIFQFKESVGHVHIHLTIPVFAKLCFHGETCTADRNAITNPVIVGAYSPEGGSVNHYAVVHPEFVTLVI